MPLRLATFSEIEMRNVLDIHLITGYRWIYCTLTTKEYLVHSHHMTVQEMLRLGFKKNKMYVDTFQLSRH